MDEVLLDNMEQDVSVWDHTEDAADEVSDIGLQVHVGTTANDTRRSNYQTSCFGGEVSSNASNQ